MSDRIVSLALPSSADIQEVVLRGPQSVRERHLRVRALSYLRREMRCRQIWLRPQAPLPEVTMALWDWQNPAADPLNFDRLLNQVRSEGRFRLVLWTRDWLAGAHPALEMLNRYQGMLPRSPSLPLPELSSASDEAVHRWRWLLRLEPKASRDLQRATLNADDAALRQAQATGNLKLLRDAADLAFFSLRSWQYLRAWGVEQAQYTVERRLARMSDRAICQALGTRQPLPIFHMIEEFFSFRDAHPAAV